MVKKIFILLLITVSTYGQQLYKNGASLVKIRTTLTNEAKAFCDSIGTLTEAQKQAVNYLVLELKRNGLFDSCKAIYPLIGGTAAAHKWNLKDPRNLDAAFRIVFGGTCTHNSNGVLFGANGYGDTKIIPSAQLSLTYNVLAVGSQTNIIAPTNTESLIGAYIATGRMQITKGVTTGDNLLSYYLCSTTSGQGRLTLNAAYGGSTKGIVIAYKNSVGRRVMFQGIVRATNTVTTNYGVLPTVSLYLGATNGLATSFSETQITFAYVSADDITDAQALKLNEIIKTYHYLINRKID